MDVFLKCILLKSRERVNIDFNLKVLLNILFQLYIIGSEIQELKRLIVIILCKWQQLSQDNILNDKIVGEFLHIL